MSFMSVLLWILGGLLALLVLLLVLPVGVQVCYDASGFTLRLAAGPVRWQLLPSRSGWLWRKLQKKPEAPPARQAAPATKAEPKKGGSWTEFRPYLPVFRTMLGDVHRRLLVRRLVLWVKLGCEDPCDLAVRYSRAWAAVGGAMPLLERAFRLRRKDIRIFCDFLAETTELYWNLELVACPARLLWVLLRQGPALLRIYEQQKNQKAV